MKKLACIIACFMVISCIRCKSPFSIDDSSEKSKTTENQEFNYEIKNEKHYKYFSYRDENYEYYYLKVSFDVSANKSYEIFVSDGWTLKKVGKNSFVATSDKLYPWILYLRQRRFFDPVQYAYCEIQVCEA